MTKKTYCGALPDSVGFSGFSTGKVTKPANVNKKNYGKQLVDQYGRSYLQTEFGKIY